MFATLFYFAFKTVDVLKEFRVQFKFGVFTKWDEVTENMRETTRQHARKYYKEVFERSLGGMQEVYFVEVENTTLASVSFESMYSSSLIGVT